MTEKELMLTALLECGRADLYAGSKPLTQANQKRLDEMSRRRQKGEPLQYILESCEFFGIKLFVDQRVLIPRPETELLVEEVLKKANGLGESLNILDLGTGSGNIAISLAKFLPHSQVTALDISQEALKLAEDNAHFHSLHDRIKFIGQDMAVYLTQEEEPFDVIVSNPPYIARGELKNLPEDVQREPKIALDGGKEGLDFYKVIIPKAVRLLKHNGFLLLEIGEDQRNEIENIFNECDCYQNIEFLKDYCGRDRITAAQGNLWKN